MMKKIYSFVAAVAFAGTIAAQAVSTVNINTNTIGGSAVLLTDNYSGGAEKTWMANGVQFGAKGITGNPANTPAGSAEGSLIQMDANNGVIYNITPFPGRIVSVTVTHGGTGNYLSLYGGNTGRLVNSIAGDYTINGGTAAMPASSTGWSYSALLNTDFTYFALKRTGDTNYITAIEVVYEDVAMGAGASSVGRPNLVKNTVTSNLLYFSSKANVQIVNLNGQVVRTAAVNENTSVDISSLPKGIYLVTADVDGKTISQKVVKR